MSANPEVDAIVALPAVESPVEPTNGHAALAVAPAAPAAPAAPKRRPTWAGSLAVGVVALIASGSLGYLSYSTAQERNATRTALVATQGDLKDAQNKLELAGADAATRLVTANYVALYTRDEGKVHWDYQNLLRCNSFGSCRTSAQDLRDDVAQFQADRKAANVPADLAGADRNLGDALSAAYAAAAQIVTAMDTGNLPRFKAGFTKLEAAMLSVAAVSLTNDGQLSAQ